MMNNKINTSIPVTEQTWKPQENKIASAPDLQEVLGGKDIGQFLNEISDPNYVDPKKMRRAEGKMDKEGFLKLLLTQLKNQDPTNPLQSHEMAAQLAQFSSLEQLSNINTSIDGLAKAQTPVHNYQSLNFIGKTVQANTDRITRNRGDTSHDLRFSIPNAAKEMKIVIRDETGAEVRTIKTTNLPKGENKITWNGTKEDGYPAFSGTYSFTVEGVAENGKAMNGQTQFTGTVTGMNFSAEGPVLMVGDQKVRISDVKTIEDQNEKLAQEMREQMRMQGFTGQAPVTTPQTQQGPAAEDRPTGNVDQIPMSREFKNSLAKETKT